MEWSMVLEYMRSGVNDTTAFFGHYFDVRDLGKRIAAMANTRGGKIVLGVDLNNYHFLGVEFEEDMILDLVDEACQPTIHLELDTIFRDEKKLIVIGVPEGKQKPYMFEGKGYCMDSGEVMVLSAKDEKEILTHGDAADREYKIARDQEKKLTFESDVSKITDDLCGLSQLTGDVSSIHNQLAEVLDLDQDILKDLSEPVIDYGGVKSGNDGAGDVSDRKEPVSDLRPLSEDGVVVESEDRVLEPEAVPVSDPAPLDKITVPAKPVGPLNERQKLALDYVQENGSIRNKEYRHLFEVSHKTAHLELIDLVGRDEIVSQGAGRSTCYVRASEKVLHST